MKKDCFIQWAFKKVLARMEKYVEKTPSKADDKIVTALKKAYDLYLKSLETEEKGE